jgi:hypothetical protein
MRLARRAVLLATVSLSLLNACWLQGGWFVPSQEGSGGGAGAPVPSNVGGGPHDQPEPPRTPGVQREVPRPGTPAGTPDELRRRKREAEIPAPGPQGPPSTPAQEDRPEN